MDSVVEDQHGKAACDGIMCADTSQGAVTRDLFEKACKAPLAPTQQEKIVLGLGEDWKLVYDDCGLTPQKFPDLAEHNPYIAFEVLLRLIDTPDKDAYFDVLVHMDKIFHSMDVVHRLTTSSVVLPPGFIHDYISKCFRSSEDNTDKNMNNKIVRSVSVFLQSLIRNKIIKVHDFSDELLTLCFSFPRIREVAGLYRLIKSLE